MTEKTIIDVQGVNFSYEGNKVLEEITFSIEKGEYLGIIGPNGGGKTTLFRIILGLLEPDSGRVLIHGKPVREFSEKFLIGYVPQRTTPSEIYFPATVEEVVKSGRTPRKGLFRRFSREDVQAVERAMETSGIAAQRGRLIGSLSGGERQRVFIARALAGEPEILILDEPEAGIDLTAQEKFYTFIEHLNNDLGITVLLISHDIDVVAHQVKTILCLNRRLVCHGPPKKFITEEYMQKLYGKQVRFIIHGH
ncbi:MAG: metal ABC transporter ATP-binding protein [Deltaproteobacteria bacterium]|nr:metal ABC transporter ATP-binding protein [Deltaproteobacteria bacterium]